MNFYTLQAINSHIHTVKFNADKIVNLYYRNKKKTIRPTFWRQLCIVNKYLSNHCMFSGWKTLPPYSNPFLMSFMQFVIA